MRKLALVLLFASTTAAADTSTVKLSYGKGEAKTTALLKKEADKHQAALDTAAHGKKFEVRMEVRKVEKTADATKCNLAITVGSPTADSMLAAITGGASTPGITDQSLEDCIEGGLADLLDKKVAKLLEDKSK